MKIRSERELNLVVLHMKKDTQKKRADQWKYESFYSIKKNETI